MDGEGMKAPEPEPGGVVLDGTGWYWLQQYVTAKACAAKWERERLKARDKLVAIMKHYDYGHRDGRRVLSVIRVKPTTFNRSAFAEDHPGLWAQYREEQPEQARIKVEDDIVLGADDEADRGGAS